MNRKLCTIHLRDFLHTLRPTLGVTLSEAGRLGLNLAVDVSSRSNNLVRRRGIVGDDVALHDFQKRGGLFAVSGTLRCTLLATLLVDRFQNMVARAADEARVALALALNTIARTRRRAKTFLGIAGAGLELAVSAVKARVAGAFATVAYAILVAVIVASPVLATVTRVQRRARANTFGARAHTRAVEWAKWGNGAVLAGMTLEALANTSRNAHTNILATAVIGARKGSAGVT